MVNVLPGVGIWSAFGEQESTMNHAITVADAIEWLLNGAITTLFSVIVLIALASLLRNINGNSKDD